MNKPTFREIETSMSISAMTFADGWLEALQTGLAGTNFEIRTPSMIYAVTPDGKATATPRGNTEE